MTKWTKKALVILLSIAVITCLFALTACAHQHEWASEWSKDETNHWHECLDEECQEKGDLAAHTWNAGEITTPATEDAMGIKTFTCTECGQTKTEEVAKLNHTHSWATELSKDATGHWYVCTKAGCDGKNGFEEHDYPATYQKDDTQHWKVCSDCGWENTKSDHIWDEGEITTPATGTSAGEKVFTCGVCSKTREEVLPKLEQYTFTFDANGGTCDTTSTTVTFGDAIDASALPTATKQGNEFLGWFVQDAEGNYTVKLGVDVTSVGDLGDDGATFTVKALWGVKVTFNAGDGVEVPAQSFEPGNCAEFVEPNKEGSAFIRWELDGAEYDFATPVTENITLTAVYADWSIAEYLPAGSTGVVDLTGGLVDDGEAMGGKAYKAVLTGSATDTKGIVVSFGEQGIDISDYAHVFIRIKIENPVFLTNCTLRAGVNGEPVPGSQGYPFNDPVSGYATIYTEYFSYDLKAMLPESANGILKTFYIARTNQAITASGQIEVYVDHVDFVEETLRLENVYSIQNGCYSASPVYTVPENGAYSQLEIIKSVNYANASRGAYVGWDMDIYTGKYAFVGFFRNEGTAFDDTQVLGERAMILNFNDIDITQYEHIYVKLKSYNVNPENAGNCTVHLYVNRQFWQGTPVADWVPADYESGKVYQGYFVYDIKAMADCPDVLSSLAFARKGAVQNGIYFYIESIDFVIAENHEHRSAKWLFNDDYSEQYKLCDYCGIEFGREAHSHASESGKLFFDAEFANQWKVCDICEGKFDQSAHNHNLVEDADAQGAVKSPADCENVAVYYKTCDICGFVSDQTFNGADVDASNHVLATFTYEVAEGDVHVKKHECCGAVANSAEACSGGTATVTDKAVCEFCGDAWGEVLPSDLRTVSFDAGAGIEIPSQQVRENHLATQPADPYKEGAIFLGWELDGAPFDFATPITGDTELTAKYVEYTISKWGTEASVTLTGLIDDKDARGQTYEAKLLSSAADTMGIKISFGADGIDVSDYAHVFIRLKIHNPSAITTCTSAISVNHEPTAADKGYPYLDPNNGSGDTAKSDDVWRGYFSYDLKELMTAADNGILKDVYVARINGGTAQGLFFYVDHIDFVEEALILENVTSINGGETSSYTVPSDGGAYSNKSLVKLSTAGADKAIILGWDMDPHTGKYAFVGNFSVNATAVSEGTERAFTFNFADIDLTQFEHVYIKIKNYNATAHNATNCTVQLSINGTTIKQGIPGTDWRPENYPEHANWVEGNKNVYDGYYVYDLKAMANCPETLSSLALWRTGSVNGADDGIMIYIESIEFVPVAE